VGVPGEGLNVEQRKRLTIGVELSAKPELLLFLDEPTSGLDSQTSWAICDLMEKLKNSGQAILCTIHQPSAMLFQRFDRLLFLAKGGKTVYFGEVGANSKVLSSYFERHGSHKCPRDANPAEWMLEVIGAAPGSHTDIDWHETWRGSKEYAEVHAELEKMKFSERPQEASPQPGKVDKESYREFAAPFGVQMREVTYRVFQQYWRTPSYIYSKAALCLFSSLFIGFAFYKAPLTQQGLQNQMFSSRVPPPTVVKYSLILFSLHALHDLRPADTANHAAFRHAARSLRGPREAEQGVRMAVRLKGIPQSWIRSVTDAFQGIHVRQYHRRAAVEHPDGRHHLLLLLLPDRALQQRCPDQRSPPPRIPVLPLRLAISLVY